MERKLKTGDVVKLKSDSNEITSNFPMTVLMYSIERGILYGSATKDTYGNYYDRVVICDWRNKDGDKLQKEFLEDQLEKIE